MNKNIFAPDQLLALIKRATMGQTSFEEVILLMDPRQMHPFFFSSLEEQIKNGVLFAQGIPMSPGVAKGRLLLDESKVYKNNDLSEYILVKNETYAEDYDTISNCAGVITLKGGPSSHAAIVTRGLMKPGVTNFSFLSIGKKGNTLNNQGYEIKQGDYVTIDGNTGRIYLGDIPIIDPLYPEEYFRLRDWISNYTEIKVRVNCETPQQARFSQTLGATGVGVCRTEHMFVEKMRLELFQKMILTWSKGQHLQYLDQLLSLHTADLVDLFKAFPSMPTCVRLLDPPLHEFLPYQKMNAIEKDLNTTGNKVFDMINDLKETNPMLGHRGCRLLITHEEILDFQIKALLDAVLICKKDGINVQLEVMVPFVFDKLEIESLIPRINAIKEQYNFSNLELGCMIETPRSALVAASIAEVCDFFSYGTNDLTQMTFGLSRDDSAKFMGSYKEKKILSENPFEEIDHLGVGELMKIASARGRSVNPNLKLGICGENGSAESSIRLAKVIGVNYISCSPSNVPISLVNTAKVQIQEN